MFMFPSEIDVFGLVVVEAFGAGLPTLTDATPEGRAICAQTVLTRWWCRTDGGSWAASSRRVRRLRRPGQVETLGSGG